MTTISGFRLRQLEPRDLETVAGFEAEISRISFSEEAITELEFHINKLRRALRDPKTANFVAEWDGQIVGWALLSERQNASTDESYGELKSLFVVEAFRVKGVAFLLTRACLDHCRQAGLVRVVGRCSAANHAMQGTYKAFGFAPRHIVYELQLSE